MPAVDSWITRGTPGNKVDDFVKNPSAALPFIAATKGTKKHEVKE